MVLGNKMGEDEVTYRQEMSDMWRKDFAEHQTTIRDLGEVVLIDWKKPGTSINYILYIIMPKRGLLFVAGDLGEATYWWGGCYDLGLEFLAGCDLQYFLSKCQASENGRGYPDWDQDEGVRRINEYIEMWTADDDPANPSDLAKDRNEMVRRMRGGGQQEWMAYLIQSEGDWELDCDGYSALAGAGRVPNARGIAHLVGLKMIKEQSTAVEAQP